VTEATGAGSATMNLLGGGTRVGHNCAMLCSSARSLVALPALVILALFAGCGSDSTATEPADSAPAPDGLGKDAAVLADAVSLADAKGVESLAVVDAAPAQPDADLAPTGEDGATRSDGSLGVADGGVGDPDAGGAIDSMAPPFPSDGGAAIKPQSKATIVVLPDTQYYASSYPSVFNQQTSWVVAQKSALNVNAVLHVGDLVDADIDAQWTVANPAMRMLDKVGIPYTVVPGNHDYASSERKTIMNNYFSPASMPWVAGTMVPGQIENNFMLVDIGPQKWLVVGIEFGARDAVVKWADSIMKTYAQYPAILVTHAYLYADNTRYDINVGGTNSNASTYQYWNPQYYGYTAAEGINDGEAMWQKIVKPNSNVKLVFSGHMSGAARLTSTRPDGTTVHQMLSDYQWLEGQNFGYGYLRVVALDYDKKTIDVQTYSPYLNQYMTDNDNKFSLDLNL
jgi:hypothetical protein